MHNLSQKVDVNIRSFYIFNSTYGDKEGEEGDKILFYHPKDIEINTKITDVGLSQAFTTFTDTFTDEPGSCEVIHTEKTLQVLYQAEPNFWFVLVLNVPKEIQARDGVDVAEYHSHELNDNLYRRLLIMSYERFCLEEGTLQMNISTNQDNGVQLLRDKLDVFFTKFISSFKLPADNVFELFRTLQYFPLDKVLFLQVHNFMESLRWSYTTIKDCLLLHKGSVVTCGKFQPSQLFLLHRLILEHATNAHSVEPLGGTSQYNSYKVYITSNDEMLPYQMVSYPSGNTLLCLFFEHSCKDIDEHYLQDLGTAINSQLYVIARDIDDYGNKQVNNTPKIPTANNTDGEYGAKYVFVNEQSFKMVQNLCEDERRASLPQNVINLIADLFTNPEGDSVSSIPNQEEIMVKSTDDFWVVKRRGNWRQRFVIVFSTKPTLLDMTKEAERLFEQDIKDGVFADK